MGSILYQQFNFGDVKVSWSRTTQNSRFISNYLLNIWNLHWTVQGQLYLTT